MAHPFLSEDWIAAAREIRARHGARDAGGASVRMNMTITGVPFGSGTVESYLDTSSGNAEMELGALDDPDVTLTTDYDTARAMFVDGDQAVAMQAFLGGRIVVQGDMMKLLSLNAALAANPDAADIAEEMLAITE
jgi:hypothetical protein